ncbi:hypothetical protein EVAR_50003_1 [Eumeta japonica]|uniref:Uncharacterized protein n=1 Tax=Eumeta variegata TaxID=151549 RepID=A0A4C1XMN2_EUMVA|nr:hypothetical protein EVAR_50003_1 [Eumeta japonica]
MQLFFRIKAASGLSSPERGVRPVYVRCGEGALRWLYPRGALRLQFAPPLPPADTEFRVCVRLLRRPDPPDIFPPGRLNDTEPPRAWRRFPARLFVEGAGRLLPLYAADDGDPRHVRCFRSRAGRAALYVEINFKYSSTIIEPNKPYVIKLRPAAALHVAVERPPMFTRQGESRKKAEPENGVERRVAELVYEARALPRAHYDPAAADCTPCTDDHLELAFCTSDLASSRRHPTNKRRGFRHDDYNCCELVVLDRGHGYSVGRRRVPRPPDPPPPRTYLPLMNTRREILGAFYENTILR